MRLHHQEIEESNIRYEKMKAEYEAIEEEVEEIDLAIETAKNQMNETNLLKQQLEGQINVLKEQINTARMNDEHYDQAAEYDPDRDRYKADSRKETCKKRRRELSGTVDADQPGTGYRKRQKTFDRSAEHRLQNIVRRLNRRNRRSWSFSNNRASTQAKIQHFDTTQEQIHDTEVQSCQKLILEIRQGEEERTEQRVAVPMRKNLSEIREQITRLYRMQIKRK